MSNIPINASPDRLWAFFEKFGEIENGPRGLDPTTGKFKGYALFVFKTVEGAKKVLEEPYKMFDGIQLHCKRAAEGKSNGGGGEASITTALQPVQPQMLAAAAAAQQVQNMALLGQHSGLVNPLYGGGMITNANLGALMGGYYGMMGGSVPGLGLGSYGVSGGGEGGSSGAMLSGLQYMYPNVQSGQTSSSSLSKVPGGTSGGGYSPSVWYVKGFLSILLYVCHCFMHFEHVISVLKFHIAYIMNNVLNCYSLWQFGKNILDSE